MSVRTITFALVVLFSSLTGSAGAVGEWVLTFNAHDQQGNPVAGVCFTYSFVDPIVNQTYTGERCTAATGSNNVAFGAQVQAADITQSAPPAPCTGGLIGTVHVVAGTPSVDAVLACGAAPPAPPPPGVPQPPAPQPPAASPPLKNQPPVAVDDAYRMPEGGTLYADLLTNDYDPDGNAMHVQLQKNEMLGVRFALAKDGTFMYRPKTGFTGNVRLQYRALDSKGATSKVATATVRVGGTKTSGPGASPTRNPVKPPTAAKHPPGYEPPPPPGQEPPRDTAGKVIGYSYQYRCSPGRNPDRCLILWSWQTTKTYYDELDKYKHPTLAQAVGMCKKYGFLPHLSFQTCGAGLVKDALVQGFRDNLLRTIVDNSASSDCFLFKVYYGGVIFPKWKFEYRDQDVEYAVKPGTVAKWGGDLSTTGLRCSAESLAQRIDPGPLQDDEGK